MRSIGETLPGQMLFISLLAAILSAISAYFLMRWYRRTVIRTMSQRTKAAQAANVTGHTPVPSARAPEILFDDRPARPDGAAQTLCLHLRRAPRQAAAIYAAGVFSYSLAMSVMILISAGIEINLLRLFSLTISHIWPIVLIIGQITPTDKRGQWLAPTAYFALFLLAGIWATISNPLTFDLGQLVPLWISPNLLPTILQLAFLYRRVRAVGPMVFTFFFLACTGATIFTLWGGKIAILFADQGSGLLRLSSILLVNSGLAGMLMLLLIGFAITGGIGWWTLKILQRQYLSKKISEQSLIFDSILLVFAFWQSIQMMIEGSGWILSGLAGFLAYKLTTNWLFKLARPRWITKPHAPRLLMLRVFSLGARSERLYNRVSKAWRYNGGIHFITGPDLVTATIEPHDFMDFLTGRLQRRFVSSSEMLERRLVERDLVRDPDGRFRVSDFFCYDDTWTMVLERLALDSDAILMDLRQFTAKNAGCIYEIAELINRIPMSRVVFLIDQTTDASFLRQAFQQSAGKMQPGSPNSDANPLSVRVFNYSGINAKEFDLLLGALASAATSQ